MSAIIQLETDLPARITTEFKLQDVQWTRDGRYLVWLESRSGRGVLVSWDSETGNRRDLSRAISVKAGIGYGGGELTAAENAVYFVSDSVIYSVNPGSGKPEPVFTAEGALASPAVSPDGRRMLLVQSCEEKDRLCLLDLENPESLHILDESREFYMQPIWHPGGDRIAWVSWDAPYMPWEKSDLHVAKLEGSRSAPRIRPERVMDNECSHFQPEFSPDGSCLSFVSDRDGWSNLHVVDSDSGKTVARFREKYEHDLPAWTQGLRTYCWSPAGNRLFLLKHRSGIFQLCRLDPCSVAIEEILETCSFTAMRQICINPVNGLTALLASSPMIPWRVILAAPGSPPRVVATSRPEFGCGESNSRTRPVRWGKGEASCFGLISGEKPPSGRRIPFVIRIHGGPTSQFVAEFDDEVCFFESLGFGVLSLNYRGSTGAGRKYRERLNRKWGEADVADVDSAARFLVEKKWADPGKIILTGGSAAGLTILRSLVRFPGRFRAAVCRYPVSNLLGLAAKTHRFEKHYLDSLIGPLPESEALYRERSPSEYFDRIRDPLAVFQGAKDPVVPREHSDALAAALKQSGVKHLYRVYPEEGHGWKRIDTRIDYYRSVRGFLRELEVI